MPRRDTTMITPARLRQLGAAAILAASLCLSGVRLFAEESDETQAAQQRKAYSCVVHVHSKMSSEGRYTLPELTAVAQSYGVDAIFLTDNLTYTIQYGLPPLRNILWLGRSGASIMSIGPRAYLDEVERENRRQTNVLYVAGAEICPRFHWTGSIAGHDLVCRDHQRNLIALGVTNVAIMAKMPEAAGYVWRRDPIWILSTRLLLALFAASCVLALWAPRRLGHEIGCSSRELRRSLLAGAVLPLALLIGAVNLAASFVPSFDIYGADPELRREKRTLAYLRDHNVLSYWAHPEAADKHEWKHMGVSFETRTDPYPELLALTDGYTGFGGVYEGLNTLVDPGGVWDRLLKDYAVGQREAPVWCFGEMLYHYEGQAGKRFGNVETLVWAGEKSAPALLDAIEKGDFYARRNSGEQALSLDEWKVLRPEPGRITVALKASSTQSGETVRVQLIKDGLVAKEVSAATPVELEFPDALSGDRGISYYRAIVTGRRPLKIVTNPLFAAAEKQR